MTSHTRWLFALAVTLSASQVSAYQPSGSAAPTTRIACLGDSITAGARVDAASQSYPARLQSLLGRDYEVRNFGIGGATLIKTGRPNIWSTLDAVSEFRPNVVVISLGTNDTVAGNRKNWEKIGRFDDDYARLISRLLELPSRPRVVICTPTPMVLSTPGLSDERRANLKARKPRLQELCTRIRNLSKKYAAKNVTLLELNAVLRKRPKMLTIGDGVHPNADGYAVIAQTVARQIQRRKKRPNIVLFLVDDMGWQDTSVPFDVQISEFNRRYHTPNMEQLAARGVKFTAAYACSVCSPSRVSLMTGLNAARHRVTNWTLRKNASNDRPHDRLEFPAWNVHGLSPSANIDRTVHAKALPAYLREAGYRTIHVGKAHFGAIGTPGSDPTKIGFDENIGGHAAGGPGSFLGTQNFSAAWRNADRVWDVPGLEDYHGEEVFLTEALTLEANKAIDRAVADHKPFFLYMSHYAVHVPFAKDERFYPRYRGAGLDKTEAMYAAMLEGMDKSLGDIMKRIQRHGLSDDTVILFMSDNGGLSAHGRGGKPHSHNKPLSSGKGSAHEGGIRVPMIVSWPGVTRPNSSCNQTVIVEDFFPSILEIADIHGDEQIGDPIDGQSFVDLLRGGEFDDRDQRAFVWHFPNNWGPSGPGIGASSAIRVANWKLIYYHDSRDYELFNLAADLGEEDNLASKNVAVRNRLASRLANYLKSGDAQMPTSKATGERVPYPSVNTLNEHRTSDDDTNGKHAAIQRVAKSFAWQSNWSSDAWGEIAALDVKHFHANSSSHRPRVRVKVAYNNTHLFGMFHVEDRFVLSKRTEYQDPVYKDSCVEFFVQPKDDHGYFNFELNAGGTLLLHYKQDESPSTSTTPSKVDGSKASQRVSEEWARQVRIAHSLPNVVWPEREEPTTWTLAFAIPLGLFEHYCGTLGTVQGQAWKANFYKCADESSHPHWGAWSPIKEELNFHQPKLFGTLHFQ